MLPIEGPFAGRVRAHPGWAGVLLTVFFFLMFLFLLGSIFPPGPFGQIPYGPVSLSIQLPSHPIAGREPILSGGVKGATYIVSIEAAGPGAVRFVYEAWGAPEQVSPPVSASPGPWYPVSIDLPQLRQPTGEAGVPLSISFNGALLMRQPVPYAPFAIKSLWIGTNPLNGPYLGRDPVPGPPRPYQFSGNIRDVSRTEPRSLSFLADRLFPNLRYEVEVAPHIFYWAFLIGGFAALGLVLFVLAPGSPRREYLRRVAFFLTPVAITVWPILPLLQISRTFRADWLNHGWMMEYYGQFLAAHHWLPRFVNSQQATGMVSPLFYGHFLYAIGGAFSALLGGDIGIRIALFLSILCQTLCVRRTVWRLTGSLAMADAASAVVCWTIYPFSNLYGGSVMEFMAVCYLSCCVCIFIDFCRPAEDRVPWREIAEFSLFLVLAANHPITGLFGGLMLAAMAVTMLAHSATRARIFQPLLAVTLLVLFLLSPWILMYAKYGSQIFIARVTDATAKLEYFEFDTLLARFMPFPWDAKSITVGALSETSYADMQLNLPLLIAALAGFGLVRWRRKTISPEEAAPKALIWLGGFILAWALIASVSPPFAALIAPITNRLRYAFRLVNFQNLGILLIVLAWCWLYQLRGMPRRALRYLPALCSVLLTVGAIDMVQKWVHGSAATEQSAIGHSQQTALTLPYTFYWLMDYVGTAPDISGVAAPKQAVNFSVLDGPRFGEVPPVDVNLPANTWLTTNTIALPVNQIEIDGAPASNQEIGRNGFGAAVLVKAGRHRIEYRFAPGLFWTVLRTVTEAAFLFLALACLILEARPLLQLKAVPRLSRSSADRQSLAYTR